MARVVGSNQRSISKPAPLIAAVAAMASVVPMAGAAVDTLTTLVAKTSAIGAGTALGAYAYDPTTDTIYSTAFGGVLQKTTQVDTAQSTTTQISATAWLNYNRGGHTDYTGGSVTPSAILLNPKAITATGQAAYSFALIMDADGIVGVGSPSVPHPELTQKLSRYNLQASSGTAGSSASDVLTPVMTLANQQSAANSTSTSGNIGRQFAWSGDGQSVYFVDTTAALGGLYKESVAGGAPVKLLAAVDENTEPAVTTANGVDTIYFRGGGTTGNTGGIDKITYDGTTASARTVAIPAAAINAFLELPGNTSVTTFAMTSDSAGNLFFNDNTSAVNGVSAAHGGIYEYDTQGRFSKVVTTAERQSYFASTGTPNGNTLRLQTRSTTYGTGAGAFPVEQLMYAESSPLSLVAGVDIFSVGDFNRDGAVNQADVALFKPELTLRGVAKTNSDDFKFDLNGNGVVDWKDVKILQQFYAIPNGDADMNLTVDYTDLDTESQNYGSTAATWIQGDFTGDNGVTFADLQILADNFGSPRPTIVDLSSRYTGQFEADALVAFGLVPEPSSITLIGTGLVILNARRRRKS